MATTLKIALIAAAAMAAAAPASAFPEPGSTYGASGTEPFWGVRFARGRMTYSSPDQPGVSVPIPRATSIRLGRRYATPRLTVEITREGRCNDGMSDNYYQETVRVWFGRRTGRGLEGCGGARVPWPELAGSRWHILSIAGQAVTGDDYFLDFELERLSGQAGCNRFSGPYVESRPTLRPGAMAATRMACIGPRLAHEQRVLRILAAPVSMNFLAANILVIGNRAGQMRLQQDH